VDNYEEWLKQLEQLATEHGVLEYFTQTTQIHRLVYKEGIPAEKLVEYWRKL
jgi:hypothetical protein